MTVAVACNLSDGVILGVDSAVTVPGPGGILKVYENAEKLFQLDERPIGVAAYGLGAIGARSIGSYLREFEVANPHSVISSETSIGAVVEELRDFFMEQYMSVIAPELERIEEKPFDQIEPGKIPIIGLVVGGFSFGAYLSEVWEIIVPVHDKEGSAECRHGQGHFGSTWFATFDPIRRYVKGFDPMLIDELLQYFQGLRGADFSPDEIGKIQELLEKYEYPTPFAAMPMEEGIAYTRFLVQLVIGHHRFAVGAPVVGGRMAIGRVTYRGDRFEILES